MVKPHISTLPWSDCSPICIKASSVLWTREYNHYDGITTSLHKAHLTLHPYTITNELTEAKHELKHNRQNHNEIMSPWLCGYATHPCTASMAQHHPDMDNKQPDSKNWWHVDNKIWPKDLHTTNHPHVDNKKWPNSSKMWPGDLQWQQRRLLYSNNKNDLIRAIDGLTISTNM